MEAVHLDSNWEDITCPICLSFPHNAILLQCSSLNKGCRPFVCDTNHLHSNCLHRFQVANEIISTSASPSTIKSSCPLCRGDVTGWVVVNEVRDKLDEKKRSCEDGDCSFIGSYMELHKHAQMEHPDACPSKIDPERQLDWENFQQSSEMIDVLSTIHSEVPGGVVLGDYVIEYGDNVDESGDESEDFRRDDGNWWKSCVLYQVFNNLRNSRNRRSRGSESSRGNRHLSYDTHNSNEGSVTSIEFSEIRASHRSSRRNPFCFYKN